MPTTAAPPLQGRQPHTDGRSPEPFWTPSSCCAPLRLRPPTAQTPVQPQKTPGPSPLLPQDVGFGCQCPPHHSTLLGRRQTEASPGIQVSMGHLRPISSPPSQYPLASITVLQVTPPRSLPVPSSPHRGGVSMAPVPTGHRCRPDALSTFHPAARMTAMKQKCGHVTPLPKTVCGPQFPQRIAFWPPPSSALPALKPHPFSDSGLRRAQFPHTPRSLPHPPLKPSSLLAQL